MDSLSADDRARIEYGFRLPGVLGNRLQNRIVAGTLEYVYRFDSVAHETLPIRNIFPPHFGQVPWTAGRPFFIVTYRGFFITCCFRHFTQYAWINLSTNLSISGPGTEEPDSALPPAVRGARVFAAPNARPPVSFWRKSFRSA